jgi:hypothetical protein
MRSRPPALRGLLSDREPFTKDEESYNKKAAMLSELDGHFDIEARNPYCPARVREEERRRTGYMDRWNQKFEIAEGTLDEHDGNPFT